MRATGGRCVTRAGPGTTAGWCVACWASPARHLSTATTTGRKAPLQAGGLCRRRGCGAVAECMCTHACARVRLCVCVHMCVHVCVHMHVCMCVFVSVCMFGTLQTAGRVAGAVSIGGHSVGVGIGRERGPTKECPWISGVIDLSIIKSKDEFSDPGKLLEKVRK